MVTGSQLLLMESVLLKKNYYFWLKKAELEICMLVLYEFNFKEEEEEEEKEISVINQS